MTKNPARSTAHSEICRYCRCIITWTTTPEFKDPIIWHGEARCVAGDEPSRKMGGPA